MPEFPTSGRRGRIVLEGGRATINIGPHDSKNAGVWFELYILREDTLDSRVTLDLKCTRGPNLMLSDIVFGPQE